MLHITTNIEHVLQCAIQYEAIILTWGNFARKLLNTPFHLYLSKHKNFHDSKLGLPNYVDSSKIAINMTLDYFLTHSEQRSLLYLDFVLRTL